MINVDIQDKIDELHDIADENPDEARESLVKAMKTFKPIASQFGFEGIDFDHIREEARKIDFDEDENAEQRLHDLIDQVEVDK